MNTRQGSSVRSIRAVADFIATNVAKLAGIGNTGAFKKLGNATIGVVKHAADQDASIITAKNLTKKVNSLRLVLVRNHMTPIARIARVELQHTQELFSFKVPTGNPTTEKLANAARGMAQAAAPHASVFIASGLPADFVAKLNSATDAMLASVDERSKNQGRTVGATKALRLQLREARQAVHILDSFVRVALVDEPALLGNWDRIRHVTRSRVRTATDAGPGADPAVVDVAPDATSVAA